jgi:hypothetical protein
MKLLIPTRKERFRLVNDLVIGLNRTLPAGTVFGIDALKINRNTKPVSRIHCLVYASPDPAFSMKKYGGTADYGLCFSLTFEELRELEVEIVEDMK